LPALPTKISEKESFFLVCQSLARHSVPTKMPRLKITGLQWWMICLLMPGSIINRLTRNAPAVASTAKRHDSAVARAQLTLNRQVTPQ